MVQGERWKVSISGRGKRRQAEELRTRYTSTALRNRTKFSVMWQGPIVKAKRQKVTLWGAGPCMFIQRGSDGLFYGEFAIRFSF